MKVETLRKIAKEYRVIADRKLDDKEICKGFSDLCRDEGIAWVQLRALVDAQAADARDGKDRAGAIVEKAGYASAYADILGDHIEDERKREIRSSSTPAASARAAGIERPNEDDRENPVDPNFTHRAQSSFSNVSIAAASPSVAQRPERSDEAQSSDRLREDLKASLALQASDAGDIPDFLDVRDRLVRS